MILDRRRALVILTVILIINFAGIYLLAPILHYSVIRGHEEYIQVARFFSGEYQQGHPPYPYRLVKPIAPLIILLLQPLVGYENGLFAQNIFFYFLFGYLAFWLIFKIKKNYGDALTGAFLFLTSFTFLRFGLDPSTTDIGGWTFYLLVLYFAVLFYQDPRPSRTYLWLGIAAAVVGFFYKEYALFALPFLIFTSWLKPRSKRDKFWDTLAVAVFFWLPLVISAIFTGRAWGYTVFSLYATGQELTNPNETSFPTLLKNIAKLFTLGWLFAGIGVARLFSKSAEIKKYRIFVLALIFGVLPILVFPFYQDRYFFVFLPFLVLMAIDGLKTIRRWLEQKFNLALSPVIFLAAYVAINYFLPFTGLFIQLPR